MISSQFTAEILIRTSAHYQTLYYYISSQFSVSGLQSSVHTVQTGPICTACASSQVDYATCNVCQTSFMLSAQDQDQDWHVLHAQIVQNMPHAQDMLHALPYASLRPTGSTMSWIFDTLLYSVPVIYIQERQANLVINVTSARCPRCNFIHSVRNYTVWWSVRAVN